jgi:hypothetical protein
MSKIKFLLANRGKGVVDSNNPITEGDLFLVENDKDLTDLNTSATKNNIFQIGSTIITESVTELKPLELTGNTLTIKMLGENGVVQEAAIDLSSLSTTESGVTNATYNASTNILLLTEADGTEHSIDLSEFSIIVNTDVNGVTTLTQEGVVKATLSKVGQSGQFADLLGKPTTLAAYGINDAYTKTEVDGKVDTIKIQLVRIKIKESDLPADYTDDDVLDYLNTTGGTKYKLQNILWETGNFQDTLTIVSPTEGQVYGSEVTEITMSITIT